jgi:hypothetical protein
MKKLSELKEEDFPSVDPERFEEWKKAAINAQRNAWFIMPVIVVLAFLIFFFSVDSGFIPAILMIALLAVAGIMVNAKANRLAKELGISKSMIKKVRRNQTKKEE